VKVGILLGDTSNISSRDSDLARFITNDRFAFDIINRLSHDINIEVDVISRDVISNLPKKTNGQGFDLLVALACEDKRDKQPGVQVRYFRGSREGAKAAEMFQFHLVKATGLKDFGTAFRDTYDVEGKALRYFDAPCVVVEPVPLHKDVDIQSVITKYSALVNAYVCTIQKLAKSS
jgi:hypothetical protein